MMDYIKINLQLFAELNTNTTGSTGLSDELKTHYDKTLIDTAEPMLVHDQFAQKRPIPRNGGKKIEFRKYASLAKQLEPLQEGITPDGQSLTESKIEAEVSQYGGYVALSDVLDLTAIDDNVVQATKALGSQAGRTLDTITRNKLHETTSLMWASKWSGTTETEVTDIADLDATAVLKVDTIRQAATRLKSANARKINGDYVAIIHPQAAYDLTSDPEWKYPHQYQDTKELYEGEIGKIAGVRFVESTEARIFAPAYIGGKAKLTVKTAISSSTTSVVVNEEIETAASCEIKCYIDGVENKITAITKGTGSSTLTVATAITSLAAGKFIYGEGGTKTGLAVYGTLVLADGAYGVTEVDGGGLQTFVKQVGSAGTADPLNQRSTVGWKAMKTAEILVQDYMVDILSCSSRYSSKASAN